MRGKKAVRWGFMVVLVAILVVSATAGTLASPPAQDPQTEGEFGIDSVVCGDDISCHTGGASVSIQNSGSGNALFVKNTSGSGAIKARGQPAVFGYSDSGAGIRGVSVTKEGLKGKSTYLHGVYGLTEEDNYAVAGGVWGETSTAGGNGIVGYKAGGAGHGAWGNAVGTGSGVAGYGDGYYGLWAQSASYTGLQARTDLVDNNYGIYTPDNLYSLNFHLGGALMNLAQNGGSESLDAGDVVVFVGVAGPLEPGGPPVILVAKATSPASTAVAGVVSSRYNVDRLIGEPEQSAGTNSRQGIEVTPAGPVAPGEFLLLVVQGPSQVKASAVAGPIQIGDLLTTSAEAGHAAKLSVEGVAAVGTVFGKALQSLDAGQAFIVVYVTLH